MPALPPSPATGSGAAAVPLTAIGPMPAGATGAPRASAGPLRAAAPRRLASAQLLAGASELEIVHGDALYRLRVTALGKLILTK